MVYCIVAGCKNRSESMTNKLRYYSFPKDDNICKQWVSACGKQKSFKIECARVCAEHFVPTDFKLQDVLLKVPKHKRRLQSGAVPSKNLPNMKRLTQQEKQNKNQETKALVEECLASYERKQNGIKSPSDGQKCELQKNKKVSKGSLTSYVSTFLSPPLEKKPLKQDSRTTVEQCTAEPLESNNTLNAANAFTEITLEEHSYSHIRYFTNGTTQTEFDYECAKELHIMRLEAENRKLKAAIKAQAKRAQENEALRSSLRGVMTNGQIKRLLHPGRQLKWNAEDIASAMSLYSAGPNAYALLRRRNFPLPSSSTLRGRAGKLDIRPGLLNSVFELMNKLNYDVKDRLCVLCFNKIKLKSSSYSDKSINTTLTRAKWGHVAIVRGLIKDWSQIIYYDIDVPMTASILKSIIAKLDRIHYVVTAVVSDMGPRVTALWDELGISESQPFFLHPSDEYRQVFIFVDVLHLIKLLRNRYIGSGFVLNGKTIDTGPINEILYLDNCELRISREHLDVSKLGLRKINLATELLSHSVSAEIQRQISLRQMTSPNALECADFIKVVSDWFEVFNSKYTSIDSMEGVKAYGVALEEQNNILMSMSEKVRNLRAPKRNTVLCFQNGVLINNTALPQMLDYITLKYGITYIITDSLNHGELERFFNIIRFKGGPNDHPTPLEFKYRLRSFLLAKMVL